MRFLRNNDVGVNISRSGDRTRLAEADEFDGTSLHIVGAIRNHNSAFPTRKEQRRRPIKQLQCFAATAGDSNLSNTQRLTVGKQLDLRDGWMFCSFSAPKRHRPKTTRGSRISGCTGRFYRGHRRATVTAVIDCSRRR